MKLLFALTLIVFLSACGQVDTPPPQTSQPTQAVGAFTGASLTPLPDVPNEVLMEAGRTAMHASLDVANRASDWKEADAMAQAAIASAQSDVVRIAIEQMTGKAMLVAHLIPNKIESGIAERALVYADALVLNGSPEVETVLATVALIKLIHVPRRRGDGVAGGR